MASKNNITENLKKYFYSGIGFASHASELVQNSVGDYIKAGKVSETDGKKIISDLLGKINERVAGVEDKYNEAVHKFITMSSNEILALQTQVEKLEDQLKAKGTAGKSVKRIVAKPKAAAKAVTKKAVKAVKKAVKKAAARKK